ncbi:glycine cleavage system aminomethyltransferase GcvT [Solwaraspora sp. WMMD791]|uniref:glycine cleavage system aminomethyltransferase GcvT n=1 Tax=Solwaraspora sp. WMMD791 TaxID=3016086 RepID=UPI00249B4D46|nr:glycine cleavage system aminomethyltransferase GcvT [Solwaraspora sp. WMMD791]WFE29549.1 glycine cleavage system aminomethyltransferase GcvT [Solwaraspora sp. WMMD791]
MTELTSTGGGTPRRSPLHDRHVALGAKFAEFGGWQMPLEYAGGGVLREHESVRGAVGLFDVSHLGKARITGPDAVTFVNTCLSNDLDRITAGAAQYTLCCDEDTGGVIDDIIAYRYADDHVFLIPNAANTATVVDRLRAAAPGGITVTNEHTDHAVLAVQGPASADLLAGLGLPTGHAYMSFVTGRLAGAEVVVCRTGYTGEHGYELVVPVAQAGQVWDAVLAADAPVPVRACGLAARDTLRTEMGYALHGQDLTPRITPVQARLGWAVGWRKPQFWGRVPLLAEKQAGPSRLLWGLRATQRAIPRPGMAVLRDDVPVGEVTSGTFSPTGKVGIGLALLDTAAVSAAGVEVQVDVRGRRAPMEVVTPPFVTSSVR